MSTGACGSSMSVWLPSSFGVTSDSGCQKSWANDREHSVGHLAHRQVPYLFFEVVAVATVPASVALP